MLNRQDASKITRIIVGAQHAAPFLLLILMTACAVFQAPINIRIALFAPFEGRYQEVGYNALYAARLAIADSDKAVDADVLGVDLLAVDDGGTEATSHAAALAQDPLVMAAVVLGYDGTAPEALKAFGDIPVIVAGDWGAKPADDNDFIMSNPQIDQQLTVSPRISVTDAANAPAPVVGGEVFALQGFAKLRTSLNGVTVLSSGMLPDADFVKRYTDSDQFAPAPGLLATLTYQAMGLTIFASSGGSRTAARTYFAANGFSNGYWNEAEVHRYHYVSGVLTDNSVK